MKGRRASTFVMIGIVAALMIIAILLINHTTIFQEGNPLPVWRGIWQLDVGGKPFAEVKTEPATYITKTGYHNELFTDIEKTYSVKYKDETDSGYVFEGDGGKLTVSCRQYSRSYQLWEIAKR